MSNIILTKEEAEKLYLEKYGSVHDKQHTLQVIAPKSNKGIIVKLWYTRNNFVDSALLDEKHFRNDGTIRDNNGRVLDNWIK
jgi:hypothetical protein